MYSQKQGKINTNHIQSSVMTLLIDKKEIVKEIHAQRKIERKLKSKKLTDIQCNTQIKNVKCAKVNRTQN